MTPGNGVGKSHRTPAKHALMYAIYGKEVGVANRLSGVRRLAWLDLTAGDAVVDESACDSAGRPLEWGHDCSVGIAAYHAAYPKLRKPLSVTAHEIQSQTYGRLLDNCAAHLERYGWQGGPTRYEVGTASLELRNGDGGDAELSRIRSSTAVLVNNDPNSVHTWAMRPGFRAELAERTPWCRIVSTMGCNASGLQKLWGNHREECEKWYGHVEDQIANLPKHHDLFLAAIENDAHKWAYLIEESRRPDWMMDLATMAEKAFRKQDLTLDKVWWGHEPRRFRVLLDELLRPKRLRGQA